jgi:hypothetical protein
MSTSVPKPPEILDKIVDVVLAHRPKPKTKAAKKRKKAGKRASRSIPSKTSGAKGKKRRLSPRSPAPMP